MTILPRILSACFAVSWALAAHDPVLGTTTLAAASSLLTLPYFVKLFGERIVENTVVAFMLLIAGTVFPLLLPLVALWGFICFINKLKRFFFNVPLILMGGLVYAMTSLLPAILLGQLRLHFAIPEGLLLCGIGLLGVMFFWAVVRLSVALGSTDVRSATLMLGVGTYLMLFLLTFLIPHADGGEGDGESH